ncbi:hypothetical protein [Musicola keenii]|uniref:hypothetical protein n=1 Tax=Musicola keenii TaxID=2884250 RepID=UPI00177C8522|nr:hypothetical protein [Musicola keenii]
MFRADFYGLKGVPPSVSNRQTLVEQRLQQCWKMIRPALKARLEQAFFEYPEQYDGSGWWQGCGCNDNWGRWYQQTLSLWVLWRSLCHGGKRQPRWPADILVDLPELEQEAGDLWFQWACQFAGSPVYPDAQQVVAALQQWLRRFELLRQVELDVSLQPSLADGDRLGLDAMQRHWPLLCQAAAQHCWLPLRVFPDGKPWQSLALLLVAQSDALRLECYDPMQQRTVWLYQERQRFWLTSDREPLRLHSFYPLAAARPALKPSFWLRCRHRLHLR